MAGCSVVCSRVSGAGTVSYGAGTVSYGVVRFRTVPYGLVLVSYGFNEGMSRFSGQPRSREARAEDAPKVHEKDSRAGDSCAIFTALENRL